MRLDLFGRINVGNNVFIGIDSVIMPGVSIGNNVVIGAKSVVTKNLEGNSVYAGNPARKICTIEDYISRKKDSFDYTNGLTYKEKKQILCSKYL